MLHSVLADYTILLGSKSPRRQKLLHDLGLRYKLVDINADEDFPAGMQGGDIAAYLCRKKADAFDRRLLAANTILVTADTIVWLDCRCIGKPANRAEAMSMLKELSGKEHSVFTGICLRSEVGESVFSSHTRVKFGELKDEDIEFYVDTYQPFDKAGSYGIQDWIGLIGVEKIDGCFYNVMGFPVQQFYSELLKFAGIA